MRFMQPKISKIPDFRFTLHFYEEKSMKTIFTSAVASFMLFSLAAPAGAECVGPVVMGECVSGTSVKGFDNGPNTGYQGSSGTRYDYDLNNPVDRNRYSIDLDAQRRDQQSGTFDAGRSLDQLQGQTGGGFKSW